MLHTVDVNDLKQLRQVGSNPTKFRLPEVMKAQRLRIAPGLKKDQLLLIDLCGSDGENTIIEPLHSGWIDADQRPDPRAGRFDFILLQLKSCHHVTLRNLCIANAWPTGILMNDCSHITIENCRFRGGKEAIYAKSSRNLTVRNCHWQQDTSPGHDLWHKIDWVEAHGEEGGNNTFAYFNGAFLGGKSLRDVVIEKNTISDAYNGIRVKATKDANGYVGNENFDIANNTFIRIRDNPIEPEYYAKNWHIRHNEIIDSHAWFSFDGVGGGHVYVYGNLGRFESRQGERTSLHHTMGRVLKLSYETSIPSGKAGENTPDYPWYVFNNSFFLRCPLIGGAAQSIKEPDIFGIGPDITRNLTFSNNVFEWCGPDKFDDYICSWIELVRHFRQVENDRVTFDGSLSNRADYFEDVRDTFGWEGKGIFSKAPLFVDGPRGDLKLVHGSEGLNAAIYLRLETPDGPHEVHPGADGINRGAWQSYGLTQLRRVEADVDNADSDAQTIS